MKPIYYIYILFLFFGLQFCNTETKKSEDSIAIHSIPKYKLVKVLKKEVEQSMKLPAQLGSYQEVSIFPKVNGYVKSVLVDIGSHVRSGQLLMILEAPELVEASIQAREKYARAISDYSISKENYERLKLAAATEGAISPMDLASAKSKMKADSALGNAEKANWKMQGTMLNYLKVTAPFNGVITVRNVHPGALVSAESKEMVPMLELKDIQRLRLEVDIPESMAPALRTRDSLSFYLSSFPGKKFTGIINRKSMNISRQFRSERVELDIFNRDEVLAPGMYADVLFVSKGYPGTLSVPQSCVVTSTERKYVWVVRNGKTEKVDVRTGNYNDKFVEIAGNIKEGETVIEGANDDIKEGIIILH